MVILRFRISMSLDGFVAGPNLFDGVGDNVHGLELVRTVAAPRVTHLKFARR